MLVRIDRSLLEPGCPSGALPPRSQPRCRSASDRGIGTRAGSVACRLASPTHRARVSGALAPTRGSGSSSSTTNRRLRLGRSSRRSTPRGMRALAVNRVEKAVITPASGTSKRVIWEQLDREARQVFPGLDLLLDSSRSHRPNEARRCTRVSERIGGRGRPRSGRELVELTKVSDGAGSRFGTPARRDTTPARAFQIPSLICGRGQRFKSSTHQQFPCVKRVRRDPRLRSRRPIGPIDQRSPRKVSRSTE